MHRFARRFVLLAALVVCAATRATAQDGGPAFGDSNWVAPYPVATEALAPDGTGPRVAERNGEALGETILRAPFRAVFFPLKVVMRGAEYGAGLASPGVGTFNVLAIPAGPFIVHPTGDISSSFGIAAGANLDVREPKFPFPHRFGGTYATRDARTANFSWNFLGFADGHAFNARGNYFYYPSRSYYGLGNATSKADRSIYLEEEFRGELAYMIGRDPRRRIEFLLGYSDYSARVGYNDGPGVLDVFDPTSAPFLLKGSEVATFGIAGRFSIIDSAIDPTEGIEGRIRIEQVHSTDHSNIDFQRYHLEFRGYAPIFSKKRVFAVRASYAVALPQAGTADVPFYRMPQTDGPYRLAGFEGRQFRDRHLAVGRSEYRWIIIDRVWLGAFNEFGLVASSTGRMRWEDIHEDYGMSLRYGFTETSIWRVELANSVQGWKFRIDLTKDF